MIFALILIGYIVDCNGYYFPVSTKIHQCCAYPVESFILREFSGPCACQILEQKWKRFVDWVEISGGYVNPWIEFAYVSRYKDLSSSTSQSKSNYDQHLNQQAMLNQKNVNKQKQNKKHLYQQQKFENKNIKNKTKSDNDFRIYSHERGMFTNIKQKYRRKIKARDVLFQIPFSITFSQFIISKYIKNNTKYTPNPLYRPKIMDELFPTPDFFMPDVC